MRHRLSYCNGLTLAALPLWAQGEVVGESSSNGETDKPTTTEEVANRKTSVTPTNSGVLMAKL